MSNLYPEAKMIEAMKIWKLPAGKEGMFPEICASGEYFAEEKIDGYFYEYESTDHYQYLFSRNTSTTTGFLSEKSANVPHLMDALSVLPPNTIIIGEIYIPGGTSKSVTTIMGCLPELAIKRQKDNPVHYYLHDIIYYDGVDLINVAAEKRYKILKAVWCRHNLAQYRFLRLAEAFDTDIEARLARILESGGEGVVLRKKGLPYYPGKRPAWSTIKMKQMDTIDLVCIGFCDPTKEYTGIELGSWQYWEHEGELIQGNPHIDIPEMAPDETYGEYEPRFTATLRATDWQPVTKPYFMGWKTAMKVGAYDDEGKLYEIGTVSSGLTDKDRELMAKEPNIYLGKVFNFTCMSLDKKEHTLRHPVFVGPRPDKNPSDCIISEIFS